MSTENEAKRAKVALILAKKLDAAADAMDMFVYAGIDCGQPYPEADDQRRTLAAAMREYSGYLESVFPK
ncbi:hypothetical protein [Polaromonas sp. JS666]|uniref:hypothetical protein n=1 Tax=Polaromonas sp. (strain JS666 / ATCC BAA-500) TaxID=296591 RepID=UPI0000464B46|nr:hypothetical protein [Polaromonas sp. JS666]